MGLPPTRSGLIARNSVLNFAGQVIPLVVGIVSIPPVIKGLGVDSFGILSLSWMLLGYFTVFDLGLGRATTKFIAEELRNGLTERLRTLFWNSCLMNLILGLAGGLVIMTVTPLLAEKVFRVPVSSIGVAKGTFYVLAISCPFVLVSTAFRGALEAAQRFEYVNAVGVIASSLTFILPVVGLLLGFDVRGIVVLLMISKLCGGLAYLILCFRVFPVLKQGVSFDFENAGRLLAYGGWVSVMNVVNPVLVYLDRFMIGSIISIAAVSYYTAPYEMVMRLSIVPASLAMALFPSFSALDIEARKSVTQLFSGSVKFLLVIMSPLVAVLVVFAEDILQAWLGPEFAQVSTGVFQVLAIGVLLNAWAQVPFQLMLGFGRPDITAKLNLMELLLYVPLVWFLVKSMGIVGGALAWSIRVAVDTLLLFVASGKFVDRHDFFRDGVSRGLSIVGVLLAGLSVFCFVRVSFPIKAGVTAAALFFFCYISWWFVFDAGQRGLITSTARRFAGSYAGGSK